MKKYSTLLFTALTLTGCVEGAETEDTTDETEAVDEAEAALPPRRATTFIVESKSFIAPIPANMIGSFGNFFQDTALQAFAATTNAGFSENPTTGAKSAKQFRVWGHVELDVVCNGSTVQSIQLLNPATDVGFEGPLKGEIDPIKSSAAGKSFSYQVSGRPNILAEPSFQAVHSRTNRTIWYRVNGHVSCDASAAAFLTIDSVPNTNFPSVRVFATRVSGGVIAPEGKVYEEIQGKFIELWSLPPVPAF
jgi:hypothetical protein